MKTALFWIAAAMLCTFGFHFVYWALKAQPYFPTPHNGILFLQGAGLLIGFLGFTGLFDYWKGEAR